MDPYHIPTVPTPPSRAEADRWLAIAEKLLAGRDLVGSKTFAIRARESDPRLEAADQILAVADTLISGDKRIHNNSLPDWYAVLQLPPLADDLDLIAAHYRGLAILLNPIRGRLCFADDAFQLVSDAWSVLSNPNRKSIYDTQISLPPQNPNINNIIHFDNNNNDGNNPPTLYGFGVPPQHPMINENVEINNVDDDGNEEVGRGGGETFWTACPYCYNIYEYPVAYEECTMRCQNCRRAFHGAKIKAPPLEDDVDTYSTWGFYPLGVSMAIMEKNKGGVANWTPFSPIFPCPNVVVVEEEKKRGRRPGPTVYIDDDDDDDDLFYEESESEGSDDEWGSTRTKKRKSGRRGRGRGRREKVKGGAEDSGAKGGQADGGVAKGVANLGKKIVGKAQKERGKLDLNVEFSHEVEEPAAAGAVKKGGVRAAHGGEEEGGIEGIGFFEGLDEFLSSLPILNVVGDDKVKAA